MTNHEGVEQAIALLTVALSEEDREPDGAVIDAVAPDLSDADSVEQLVRGLAQVSAWLLMHLEELSGERSAIWLRRAALDFA